MWLPAEDAIRRIAVLLLAVTLVIGTLPGGIVGTADAASLETPTHVSITELQSNTTDDGATVYADQNVTVTGVVTAVKSDGFFLQNASAADPAYSGVFVFTSDQPTVSVGDAVKTTGLAKEYFGLTEVDVTSAAGAVNVTGSATAPEPVNISTENASQEAYESVYVRITDLNVTSTPDENGEWDVSDGSAPLAVDDVNTGDDTTPTQTGASIDAIEGPVFYSFGQFKIQPSAVKNLTAPTADNPANETQVTLIGYNDIGKAAAGAGDDTLGRMITLINEQRNQSEGPVFVAGGGDEVSPHALRNYDGLDAGWEPPVTALNIIDPDAEVVQNHELDYDEDAGTNDFEVFENISEESTYPWLLANVVDEEDGSNLPGTQNYTVVERDGVRVGFFGVTDEVINAKTDGVIDRNGYEVLDPTTTSQRVVDTLRTEENVDIVVGLAPLGIPDSKDLARNVDGIDVIISGDDQQRYAPTKTDGTLIAETSGSANAFAKMTLTVENGSVTDSSGTLVDVTTDTPRNDTWQEYINPLREEYLNTPVVTATMPEHTGVASSYTDDTSTGLLITESVRQYTGADAALTNAGGIRDTLYPGSTAAGEEFAITRGMVTSTLSFGNQVVVVNVTGAELRQVIKSQIYAVEADNQYGAQMQQQVAGVTFEWVPHANGSSPTEGDGTIQDLTVGGEPVNDSETYTLATNSYIADGGSGYPLEDKEVVTYYNGTTMAQAVVDHLETREAVGQYEFDTEYNDRMRRVDTTLAADAITVSDDGSDTVLTIDAPDRLTGVAGTASISDRNDTWLGTSRVTYDAANGTVVIRFNTDAIENLDSPLLAPDSGHDLYVPYTDAEYASQYENFDNSVLNVDLERSSSDDVDAGSDGITLAVGGDDEVPLTDERTFTVTASDVPNGVGAYELNVTLGNGDIARISGVSFPTEPGLSEVSISDDGTTAHVEVALAESSANGTVELFTVTVVGESYGATTTIELEPAAGPYSQDGTGYDVARIDNEQLSVVAGDVTGNNLPMADVDDDGTFEDVNGDGSVDIVDAQALFATRNEDPVRSSTVAFDQNGDNRIDVGDVQRLFAHTDD